MAGRITIYGIKNCDTMKKARAWLDTHKVAYAFHDYKTAGIEQPVLEGWAKQVGWETLLNRAGTTFKKLPDDKKAHLGEKKAIALMLSQPSMIKRPVLDLGGGKLLVGFRPELYDEAHIAARCRGPCGDKALPLLRRCCGTFRVRGDWESQSRSDFRSKDRGERMKHFLLGTTFLLAGSVGPIVALQAAERGCEPPNAAMTRAEVGSQSAGSTAIRLTGDRAERFFDYLNDKVGRTTDY